MSSDRYACAECGKYWHVLDLYFDDNQRSLCKGCLEKYEAVYLPNTDHKIPMPEVKPPKCDTSWIKPPNISPEKTGSPGPDSDHYTVNGITPMEYVKAMGQNEYRGACILNIIKYVSRYPYKGSAMKDLEKARWYIDQLIIAQGEVEAAEK